MTLFLQACAVALLVVILILSQGKAKDMGMLLSLAGCCLVALVGLNYLGPVLDFLSALETLGNLDSAMIGSLMKIAGIGMVTEIASLVCADSGNGSLGKAVQLMGTAVVLWLSVPLFTALVELVQKMLGEL